LSDKKRSKLQPAGNPLRAFVPVPNTPMKRSQTEEEKTQQERYCAEISYRFSSKISLASTKSSAVYRVTDKMGTTYVLKELNPSLFSKKKKLQRAALNEYKNAKLVRDHPNILRYDTYWKFGPYICFQMEYLPGGSLERYIQENPLHDSVHRCEKEIVWHFLRDLLTGLDCLHKRNIVHLDIKPSNILVSIRPGSSIPLLKIGDFGLSRQLGSVKSSYEGFKRGDGRYLAPELLDSKVEMTTAVDIFSLGVTVYEMASDYTANEALWDDIINGRISYNKISKELKGVLGQMLCKNPEFRITAGHCLLINDKLQQLEDDEDFIIDMSHLSITDDMEHTSSSSSYDDEINPKESVEESLIYEPIRRKLF